MDNSVVIKGNKNGIVVILDDSVSFETIREKVATKFSDSAKFLGACKTAVTFEGRKLSGEEELELVNTISANSSLEIVCILNNDETVSASYEKAINNQLMDMSGSNARFFKGNLRSGQLLEMDSSVIIIGDVNPGANVVSNGNIIVLGALKGTAFAGATGNSNAFVLALDMKPVQIRIADVIARSPDNPEKDPEKEPKIAFLDDENIYIEPVTKSVLNDIKL